MQKIIPFLWFDHQAEEAVNFYTSIFKNSRIGEITRYGENVYGTPGTVMTISFQLEGQDFVALNGGPDFTFSPAISFYVSCETQAEIDELWEKLSAGGETEECGRLKDQYGISWQIVPAALGRMLNTADAEAYQRVMQALLQMKKLDLDALQRAYRGGA